MRALLRWLVALVVVLLRRRRRPRGAPGPAGDEAQPAERLERERRLPEEARRLVAAAEPAPRAELAVLALLGLGTLCAAAFIAVYALDRIPHQTQFLGLSLGLALAFFSAASLVTAKRLVPQEEVASPYPAERREPEEEAVARMLEESGDRLTRRRLLELAVAGAGATLGAALIVPAVSLGPILEPGRLRRTPWRRGVRLVDSAGRPLVAAELDPKSFYTAFPEGASRDEIGSPLVVVRLDPARLELPRGRESWAPDGIVAYSKICTHAGCAISLYRTPLYEPTSARPALVCPCHYSTFDPARGAAVMFGPAGRPLPQLPLRIDRDGHLVAGGGFSGAVGPSWWGVRFET